MSIEIGSLIVSDEYRGIGYASELDRRGIGITDTALAMLRHVPEACSGRRAWRLVGIRSDDFTSLNRTVSNVIAVARRFGYRLGVPALGPTLRMLAVQPEFEQFDCKRAFVFHEPLKVRGVRRIFNLHADGGGRNVLDSVAVPSACFLGPDALCIFVCPPFPYEN